ncbi:MAG TPA: laccase domain-containing protein, partial [Thermoanaerobaculia bacterium]|nr:laccase domain-containing protein [Thermoanaerobaculia bacterium]
MTPGGLASFAIEGPFQAGGTTFWRAEHGRVRLLFAGRGPEGETAQPVRPEREEVLERIAPGAPPVAWARQIHSNLALPASAGPSGEGDALVASRDAGLALAISTADCVPVLLAGPTHLAAAHAGWRGLASGVIAA